MASSLSLHCDLVSSIVRGIQNFRRIELANELAEEFLLEARMAVCVVAPDGKSPSPFEILQACEAIQANWTDEDRDARWARTRGSATRWLTPEQVKARKKEYHRIANCRRADARQAAGLPRYPYKPKGERAAVAC